MENDELKILQIGDIVTVAERLKEIGAEEKWSGNQTITTFDWSNEFYRKQDTLIYLTEAESYSKITVCTNNSSSYHRKVYETNVGNDYDQTYEALTALGFLPYTKVDVIHYHFVYHDLSLQLNAFPKIPAFMEVTRISTPLTSLISTLNLRNYIICEFEIQKIHAKYGIDYFKEYHI